MKPLISIIVPIYKVEDVLVRCLDSLCRQSLRDIEVILIDDASTDMCCEICEEYAVIDKRFRVIHHEVNRGLSAARNTGIKEATADYLMFVDSDDYVHKDFCRLPYECAVQKQADLVLFSYQSVKKDGSVRAVNREKGQVLSKLSRLEAIELMSHEVGYFAWNKLYSRKLFNNVSYPEGYLYEDAGTTHKTFLLADRIYYLNKALYYHYYREGSITRLRTEKALHDYFMMFMQQYRDLASWGYQTNKLELLLNNIVLTYCIRKKTDSDDAIYVFCRNTLRATKTVPKGFTWRRKIMFILLKYCPSLFDSVCILWGQRW